MKMLFLRIIVVLMILIPCRRLTAQSIDRSPPWTVFTPADNTLPMGPNLIVNSNFEAGPAGSADNWTTYAQGYTVDETGGMSGSRAIELINSNESQSHGAYQPIILNQTVRKPLYFSAFSRADSITGNSDANYSLYLDIYYIDDTPLYGQTLRFSTGTHAWEFREGFIIPAKPIKQIYAYCLLRNTHSGTAWFDNLSIHEVEYDIVHFDEETVAIVTPPAAPFGGSNLPLQTADGLSISLASDGGAITELELDGSSIHDELHAFASGFIIRDIAAGSDYINAGGSLIATEGSIAQTAAISDLGLLLEATYTASSDRISIHVELQDTTGSDRALTVYYSLPVLAEGWVWGDDIRSSRMVTGSAELRNFRWTNEIGAHGHLSKYPFANISNEESGLSLAIPLSRPVVHRLIHNPLTHQFYVAFDIGISPLTSKFPYRAELDLSVYANGVNPGFRAAATGYYARYPSDFQVRIPASEQGIWVAFSDLSPIPSVEDFGIRIHELGSLSQIAFDDAHGILSFRYVSEPWSHWLPINDPEVDVNDYDQVIGYLIDRYLNGSPGESDRAEATLSSGFFDDTDRYVYEPDVEPWCSGVAGCAVFTLLPDPDIDNPVYPLNKAHHDWNQTRRDTYLTYPGLDGEYIDSYLARTTDLDFREDHFAAVDFPLTFRTSDRRLGIPGVFGTTEFASWITNDVHDSLGRRTMANGILIDMAWGANLFDFMGIETDWLSTGTFSPPADAYLSYYRTMSGKKPYGFLMNTNFDNLTYALVERYFQVCLFYGIYPSMFSHNASEDRYWDNPALYERDRPLFVKYIPLVRALNAAGWEPISHVTANNPSIYVERFGNYPNLFVTLRNTSDQPVEVAVIMDSEALGLPAIDLTALTRVAEGDVAASYIGGVHSVTMSMNANSSEVLEVLPLVLPATRWPGIAALAAGFGLVLVWIEKKQRKVK